MQVGLSHFLLLAALLFALGLVAVITKRNAVTVLMGVELILNAANLNFIAFARYRDHDLDGQVIGIFVIIIAAANVAVALAIVLNIYQRLRSVNLDEADSLAG
ncbi:MAG: NADH-quinone oxidoreductase subunit NuoK [candidate division KSB1 bacterium]|nr:NADH-quinone oxidoreductase subunit NuoK [candidate division KSB1 bacterium]MDZ7274894.1 NADH-quinone oxidoreductase subunit NuoK [candidate division KSB1 bacterium]MDZ7286654.1 NADH-quinone oxidoreductase subunit NuoK [candidate division KSB1 bacterium]MDZ7299183.1 NADH-quinone oxidoreductase subunit NuoK [candidate division KSB1 bacterium]MDZ7308509.1 NADH-quinone oxidoreductase subunit NuoK [candidate division KSB1 bacterium]